MTFITAKYPYNTFPQRWKIYNKYKSYFHQKTIKPLNNNSVCCMIIKDVLENPSLDIHKTSHTYSNTRVSFRYYLNYIGGPINEKV